MKAPGLRGHLRLVCELDAAGRSILREQSFCAPVHLGKTFQMDGCCLLNVVNPAAGLLAGDRLDWEVEVRAGARLILSSPSASRAHTMATGQAEFRQRYRVEPGGWLEVSPSLFIPQKDTRYVQNTGIDLAEGAGLFFLETLAPGRVAAGEVFAFQSLDWRTDVRWDGALVLKERYRLAPGEPALRSLRTLWDPTYYASAVIVHPDIDMEVLIGKATDLSGAETLAGASALRAGGAIVKLLSRTSPALRTAVERLREIVYGLAGMKGPSLRR